MSKEYRKLFTKRYPDNEIHAVYDANLKGNATLHRFVNPGGDDYSAIYLGDAEQGSQVRSRESAMIEWWNGTDEESGAWEILCENPLPPL